MIRKIISRLTVLSLWQCSRCGTWEQTNPCPRCGTKQGP